MGSKSGNKNTYSYHDKLFRSNGCVMMDEESKCEMVEEETQVTLDTKEEGMTVNGLCPIIQILKEEWRALCEPWKQCLIVKMLRKTLGYRSLKARLQKLWMKERDMEFTDIGNDCFFVKFLG